MVTDPASVKRLEILVTIAEAAQIDELAIADAIEFRRSIGMRADDAWVRAVQRDPRALVRYGFAMSEDEASALDSRIQTQLEVAPAIEEYGQEHADEWAGVYIDRTTGAVVSLFTGHIEAHRQALLALFAPGVARIEARDVQWSTAELDALNAAIWVPAGQAWFENLGVQVIGGGARVIENDAVVEVRVPAAVPGLAEQILAKFDPDGTGWLTVEVHVEPAMALPFGELEVSVIDSNGQPMLGVRCWLVPDVVGAGGDSTIEDTDDRGVCRWRAVHATGYRIEVRERQGQSLLGSGRVTVPADGTGRVTIEADGR